MTDSPTTDKLLTALDVAKMLSCSMRAVWRMRAAGILPSVKIPNAGTRFRQSDVLKIIRDGVKKGGGS